MIAYETIRPICMENPRFDEEKFLKACGIWVGWGLAPFLSFLWPLKICSITTTKKARVAYTHEATNL